MKSTPCREVQKIAKKPVSLTLKTALESCFETVKSWKCWMSHKTSLEENTMFFFVSKSGTLSILHGNRKSFLLSKLMRLDRGLPEIRPKSYSNWLLIDFCNSNYVRASIEIFAMIQIRTKKVRLYRKIVNFDPKSVISSKRSTFLMKLTDFWYKSTVFD